MNSFYKLSIENQKSAMRFYEALTQKKYEDFERRMEEEEFDKCIEERKKVVSKMKKYIKDKKIIS